MTSNLDLWNWFKGASSGPTRGRRAEGTILMRDASGKPTLRFTLSNCLPIKIKAAPLNAKEGMLALEEIQIAYDHFTVESAADGSSASGVGTSASASISAGISVGAGVSANLNVQGGFSLG